MYDFLVTPSPFFKGEMIYLEKNEQSMRDITITCPSSVLCMVYTKVPRSCVIMFFQERVERQICLYGIKEFIKYTFMCVSVCVYIYLILAKTYIYFKNLNLTGKAYSIFCKHCNLNGRLDWKAAILALQKSELWEKQRRVLPEGTHQYNCDLFHMGNFYLLWHYSILLLASGQ